MSLDPSKTIPTVLDVKFKSLIHEVEDVSYKSKPCFFKQSQKQRKIITLFLISDQESQFTAHIIFDLISDQMFLSETQQQLSDVLFNSLHWNIQKSFKISNTKFEESKKKIQNLTVNDVPYESRILALKAPEHIKAKAMDWPAVIPELAAAAIVWLGHAPVMVMFDP